MALAADTARNILGGSDPLNFVDLPVKASTTLYRGAFCEDASGLIRGCTASSSNVFAGIAVRQANNGSGADSAITVRLQVRGVIRNIAVTGAASADDVNATVYASADDTLTLTSTNNIAVGKVRRWISSTLCDVYFESGAIRSI